jgi:hypothetical protein
MTGRKAKRLATKGDVAALAAIFVAYVVLSNVLPSIDISMTDGSTPGSIPIADIFVVLVVIVYLVAVLAENTLSSEDGSKDVPSADGKRAKTG